MGNDNAEGNPVVIAAVTSGTGVTAVPTARQVTFTPAANYNGAASFSYTVTDGAASRNSATVTSTWRRSTAPVANNDSLAATEDTAVTYTAAQLLGNDTDANGDPLTIASVTSGIGGTAVLNANGTVTFTPAADFNGAASFSYTATDGALSSNSATVTVNVAAVNDGPTISAGETAQLVELTATNPGTSGSVAVLILSGGAGPAFYDIEELFGAGWVDNGNGNFIRVGAYGTAALNTNANTLSYLLDNAKADHRRSSPRHRLVHHSGDGR